MIGAVDAPLRRARPLLLVAGFGAAAALRVALGGHDPGRSAPAGAIFAIALLALAAVSGWRPGKLRLRSLAAGGAGAAVLCLPVLVRHGGTLTSAGTPAAWLGWAPLVVTVAVAEEIVLRGALFDAVEAWAGPVAAVSAGSLLFALLHLPLYGAGALPLDAAVGVWLGCLRVTTGGVAAPAVAHALADLGAWWL